MMISSAAAAAARGELFSPVVYAPAQLEDYSSAIQPYITIGAAAAVCVALAGFALVVWGRGGVKPSRRAPAFPALFPLAAAVAVFALSAAVAGVESIHNMEETYLGCLYTRTLSMLNGIDLRNNHFPLYRQVVMAVFSLGGGLVEQRMVSAAFLAVSVIPFYNFLRARFAPGAAAAGTAMYALSPMSLYYACAAEPYSLLLMETAFFVWLFSERLENPTLPRWPLIATAVAGCYTHQFFFFLIAAALLSLLLCREGRRKFRDFAFVFGAVFILASPMAVYEAVQFPLKDFTFRPQAEARIYIPYDGPALYALRDFAMFFTLQFAVWPEAASAAAGAILAAVVLGAWLGARKEGGSRRVGALFAVFTFLLYLAAYWGYLRFMNPYTGGWYPLWRHGIICAPFVFAGLAAPLSRAFERRRKVAAGVFAALIAVQGYSAYGILAKKNIPDSSAAWEYIEGRVRDGDAFIATPATLFMLPVFNYHAFPRENFDGYPTWMKHGDATILSQFGGQNADYPSMAAMGFVRRIWNLRYDFRFFGAYEEFDEYGQKLFDREFAGWKVVEERSFPFLKARLLEAPRAARIEADEFTVTAGINDMKLTRTPGSTLFTYQPARRIAEETEVFAPESAAGRPARITVESKEASFSRRLSTPDNHSPGAIRMRILRDGYAIPLGFAAGREYERIVVTYR